MSSRAPRQRLAHDPIVTEAEVRQPDGSTSGRVARALGSVASLFRARSRRVAMGSARAHVEFREVDGPDRLRALSDAMQRVAATLGRLSWVEVNPDTRRVVFSFEQGAYDADELCAAVEAAEREAGLDAGRFAEDGRWHPADHDEGLRRFVELLADTAAFVFGLSLRLSPLPVMPFAGNIVAILSLMNSVPKLREGLEARLGRERAEFVLNLATSLAQGVAQRPFNSLVDALHKLSLFGEVRSQGQLWRQREADLCKPAASTPEQPPPVAREERPVPLPQGPIEEYIDQAVLVSLGGFGLSFVTTRSFQRATAALFSALPRPARLGRDVFGARLAKALAERGVLVLDPHVLRRLDRVDCLVLDDDLLGRREFVLGAVVADDPDDTREVRQHAEQLFNPKRPLEVRNDGLWQLGPFGRSDASADRELVEHALARSKSGGLVLSLERAGRMVAVVEVEILAQTGVEELIDAAHDAEMRVVALSADRGVLSDLNADDVIPASEGLLAGVRRLQREGRVVCVVSATDAEALDAADCGVALCSADRPTPWSADLLVGKDLGDVHFILQSCAAARRVSKRSVNIAMGAATLGTVASAGGLVSLTHRRVMFVVNAATLVSMFNSVRASRALEVKALPAPRDPTPWHALDADGVLARLGSSAAGLAPSEVSRRRGLAIWTGEARGLSGLGDAITDELFNPLAPLLAAGAALSAMVGSLSDAAMLGSVVGLNAVVGGVQRFRTERRIRILSRSAPARALVRRHGSEEWLEERELVAGDVIVLGPGDTVPADCRVIEARGLEVDASSLTGESLPVVKHADPSFEVQIADRSSMLYAGTAIAAGNAIAVVVAVGDATVSRHGALGARAARGQGGVEKRLRALMDLTGPVAMAACVGVVGGGLLRGRKLQDLVGTGVSLAVASVPEGLPILATAAQLSAAERLSQRKALVRNPRSIEALGRIDVICVDKTGTVTRGQLELSEIFARGRFVPLADCTAAEHTVVAVGTRATAAEQRRLGAADPTDDALRRAGEQLSIGVDQLAPGWARTSEVHFAPGRNYHATLGSTRHGPLLSVKGAPEVVLELCDRERGQGELSESGRAELLAEAARLGERGLRVLAVAETRFGSLEPLEPRHVAGLEFVGFLAFSDPVRPSARRAVAGIRRAGVRTLMLTGDHPSTAEAIATELGLLDGRRVVSGHELGNWSDEELDEQIDGIGVFARVTPSQKVRVVRALQRTGHVVGMVGDGTNDAPAIRLADCGIAIGEHGTQAARGAADVVLMDGRVETLVDAIVEGRAMWASVRDAVSILLGGNLGEIGFTLGVGLIEGRPPLNARQLLLVNLLTDVAPAMAIALRPPSPDSLEVLATLTPEETLGRPLNRQIAARAVATTLGASGAWIVARFTGSRDRARTVALAALVGSQLGQTLRSGGSSRPVVVTSLLSTAALATVIQTPGLSHFFGCRPLGPIGWGTAIVASIAATRFASAADRVLSRDVLTPLRLAERWSERPAEETSWYAGGDPSLRPRRRGAASERPGARPAGAARTGTSRADGAARTGTSAQRASEADQSGRGSVAEPGAEGTHAAAEPDPSAAPDVVQGVFVDGSVE
ncbi:MAG TPA: HAD-IC family P-type ATPase [Polyangiaceae bacterium]|nr:HAD-IC family P-type ATPase [Polyangiaceae bacterium]